MKNLMTMAVLAILLSVFCLATTASAATIYLGIEDIKINAPDRDYNDMVVKMSGDGLNVINTSPGQIGAWQPMVAPNEDGNPYWDNTSFDGAQMNIGYFITGTGAYAANPNSPDYSVALTKYWGNGTSSDPNLFLMDPGTVSTMITLEVSAWETGNKLYYYNPSNPLSILFPTLIYGGSASEGTVASFNPAGSVFGLMFQNASGEKFYSGIHGGGQFAPFMGEASGVPEPGTYAMMGAGLLFLAFVRRRKT